MAYKTERGLSQIFKKQIPVSKGVRERIYDKKLLLTDIIYNNVAEYVTPEHFVPRDRAIVEKFSMEGIKTISTEIQYRFADKFYEYLEQIPADAKDINNAICEKAVENLEESKGEHARYLGQKYEVPDKIRLSIPWLRADDDIDMDTKIDYYKGKLKLQDILSKNNWSKMRTMDLSKSIDISNEQLEKFLNEYPELMDMCRVVCDDDASILDTDYNGVCKMVDVLTKEKATDAEKAAAADTLRKVLRTYNEAATLDLATPHVGNLCWQNILKYVSLDDVFDGKKLGEHIVKQIHNAVDGHLDKISQLPFGFRQLPHRGAHVLEVYNFDDVCSPNYRDLFTDIRGFYERYFEYNGHKVGGNADIDTRHNRPESDPNRWDTPCNHTEFLESLRRVFTNEPSNFHYRDKGIDYRNVGGEFREQNPKLFIDDGAPDELKDAFYEHGVNIGMISQRPDSMKFLRDKNFEYAFDKITIRNKLDDKMETTNIFDYIRDKTDYNTAIKMVTDNINTLHGILQMNKGDDGRRYVINMKEQDSIAALQKWLDYNRTIYHGYSELTTADARNDYQQIMWDNQPRFEKLPLNELSQLCSNVAGVFDKKSPERVEKSFAALQEFLPEIDKIDLEKFKKSFSSIDYSGLLGQEIPSGVSHRVYHVPELNQLADGMAGKKNPVPFEFANKLVAGEQTEKFPNDTDFKNFKRVEKIARGQGNFNENMDVPDFYTFAYNIGCFSKNPALAQKANTWLEERLTPKKDNAADLTLSTMHSNFESWKPHGVCDEFAEFLFGKNAENKSMNFDEIRREQDFGQFLRRIYDEFANPKRDLINGRFRNEKGKLMFCELHTAQNEQGQDVSKRKDYKPTVARFKEYFANTKFSGIETEEDKAISTELAKWKGMEQVHFDRAKGIIREYNEKKLSTNIVGKHIADISNEIADYKKKTEELTARGIIAAEDVVKQLGETANKNFTYDFLEKNDPMNFCLGLYCNCCANLAGVGYGIMRSNFVHPDIQNLVIKNADGNPVAKSTLYVNREEGYGVFNNVEVEDIRTENEREEIFKSYMEGINAFAAEYNKQNPDKPIKKISVGMNLNNLSNQILRGSQPADILTDDNRLKGISFGQYGIVNQQYDGDWSKGNQFLIWRAENEGVKNEKGNV